jgi:hypothetical protein
MRHVFTERQNPQFGRIVIVRQGGFFHGRLRRVFVENNFYGGVSRVLSRNWRKSEGQLHALPPVFQGEIPLLGATHESRRAGAVRPLFMQDIAQLIVFVADCTSGVFLLAAPGRRPAG